jgi:Fe2+ transport system protein FeoA
VISLASASPHVQLIVREVALPAEDAIWLAAVGLEQGEVLTLLRRAPLGDPLHVRMDNGAEFALARSLAEAIFVEVANGEP